MMLMYVAIALAGVGLATSVVIDSKENEQDARLFAVNEIGTLTNRQLRTEESDEERVITGLNWVTSALSTGAEKVADAVRLRAWLSTEKSADDVLEKLKLNERLDDAIASPKLKILGDYVDMFNNKYPHKHVSLVGTLSSRYGEDRVAVAIAYATQVDNTMDIAAQLQFQQIYGWFTSGNSADDVFKKLKIIDDGPSFVLSQKLDILDEYIRFLNSMKPQEKTKLFWVLRNGFGGDGKYAIVVSRAMEISSLKAIATTYQNALFKRWYKSNVDPTSVLTRIFHVDEKNLASVGAREKSIADQYKTYYDSELGLDQIPSFVNPRRE
ncbi:RxLR effector family [Phytophthora palmivora]|uniref:RxLR effector family n=1 Tax=Phytophthora palmivora TaxID=4796 RepID=A0A2P4YSS7_9STRA|nr:RxLR effector family [Phytophthora palmivora]